VQGEGVLGVVGDGVEQRPLVAALRHPQRDVGAAQPAQPVGERLAVGRQRRHQHLARDVVVALAEAEAGARRHPPVDRGLDVDLVAVGLGEELPDQLAGGEVLDLVDDVPPLPADPAAAHVEDLHRCLELVLGDPDDVGVGGVGEHDRLLLQRPLERADVVAQPGRPLVLLGRRRGGHLLLQPLDVARGAAGHEVAEVVDDLPVLLGGDLVDAGRGALVDVAEQAGRPTWPARLNTPLLQVRAGNTRSSRSSVSRMAHAWA
jgi:hypothetical protein